VHYPVRTLVSGVVRYVEASFRFKSLAENQQGNLVQSILVQTHRRKLGKERRKIQTLVRFHCRTVINSEMRHIGNKERHIIPESSSSGPSNINPIATRHRSHQWSSTLGAEDIKHQYIMLSAFVREIAASLVVYVPYIMQDWLKGVNRISNPAVSLAHIPHFVVGCGAEVGGIASFDSIPH